jgi:hypothetical protein
LAISSNRGVLTETRNEQRDLRSQNGKKEIDKLSTGLSNCGLVFVFNKTRMPGGVWLRDTGRGLQSKN